MFIKFANDVVKVPYLATFWISHVCLNSVASYNVNLSTDYYKHEILSYEPYEKLEEAKNRLDVILKILNEPKIVYYLHK